MLPPHVSSLFTSSTLFEGHMYTRTLIKLRGTGTSQTHEFLSLSLIGKQLQRLEYFRIYKYIFFVYMHMLIHGKFARILNLGPNTCVAFISSAALNSAASLSTSSNTFAKNFFNLPTRFAIGYRAKHWSNKMAIPCWFQLKPRNSIVNKQWQRYRSCSLTTSVCFWTCCPPSVCE